MSTEARATRPPPTTHLATLIASLDARGRGVARVDAEEISIEGALTGEMVLHAKVGLAIIGATPSIMPACTILTRGSR